MGIFPYNDIKAVANEFAVIESKSDKSVDDKDSDEIQKLDIKVFDAGGSATVTFNSPGENYKCRVVYRKDGEILTENVEDDGFVYIKNLNKGKIYHAVLICTDGENSYSEKFDMRISKKTSKNVTLAQNKKCTKVKISWSDFAPNQTYMVYRKSGNDTKKLTETKDTYFIDKEIKSGIKYTYTIYVKSKLYGYIKVNNTSASITCSNKTDEEKLKSATGTAKADFVSGKLKWNFLGKASGYYIYRRETGKKNYSLYKTVKGKTNCKIPENDNYEYGITPFIKYKSGKIITGNMITAESLPVAVTGFCASTTGSKTVLSWDKMIDNATYHIYRLSDSGTYKLICSTDKANLTLTNKSTSENGYYKIIYTLDDYKSSWSSFSIASVSKSSVIYSNTTLRNAASWDSGKICDLKKGSKAYILGKSGNFCYVSVNGKTGYVYKRAVDNTAELNISNVTVKTLDAYLDDIIFKTGTSPKAIWTYVNDFRYNASRADRRIVDCSSLVTYRKELATNMLKYKSGMCYHYAALAAELLERVGYSVKLAYCPHKSGGFHCYAYLKIDGDWKIFDTCRHVSNKTAGYLPERKYYLNLRSLNGAKEEVSEILM